jgi:hypothetical protein
LIFSINRNFIFLDLVSRASYVSWSPTPTLDTSMIQHNLYERGAGANFSIELFLIDELVDSPVHN